jgi:hypothetical protein
MDNGARLSVINEMKRRLSVEFTPAEGVTLTWREAISRGRYIPLESPK